MTQQASSLRQISGGRYVPTKARHRLAEIRRFCRLKMKLKWANADS